MSADRMDEPLLPFEVRSFTRTDGLSSFALLGPDGLVGPVKDFVNFELLTSQGSPNTLRAKVYDLKHWFAFLHEHGLIWDQVTWKEGEVLARYADWLRFGDQVSSAARVIPMAPSRLRSEATVARALSNLYGFYEFHHRTPFATSVRQYGSSNLNRHAGVGRYQRRSRPVRVKKVDQRAPDALTRDQVQHVKEACTCTRDHLLVSLMVDRGLRVGQVLGLRHEDWDSRKGLYSIVPRNDNVNGARAKTDRTWVLPATREQVALHRQYMFEDYGDLPCGYLFINLHGATRGEPMTYHGVARLVKSLSQRVGVEFHAHTLRHTFATLAISDGAPLGVVQTMLTHKDAATTSGTYVHLQAETLRRWLDGSLEPHASVPGASSPDELRLALDGRTPPLRRKDA